MVRVKDIVHQGSISWAPSLLADKVSVIASRCSRSFNGGVLSHAEAPIRADFLGRLSYNRT